MYKKDGEDKIGEKIKYWTFDICDLLMVDFEQFFKSEEVNFNICYGYRSNAFEGQIHGCYMIIGANHGAGKSRYLLRTLITDSNSMRSHGNKPEHGTRTIQFAEIDCKKDVHQV